MAKIRAIVKYHGGKGQIFYWVINNFPSYSNFDTYVEPFGGAASVLLNKEPSKIEVYNEIEPCMFHLVNMIKNNFDCLIYDLRRLDYSEETFFKYKNFIYSDLSPVQQAVRTYVLKRMSRSGWEKQFSWSKRIYSRGPGEVHCWLTSLDNLEKVNVRLQSVILSNRDAKEVIQEFDSNKTFFYIDPPYLSSTRTSRNVYKYEFNEDQHKSLSEVLIDVKAKVLLSGYPSEQYLSWYDGWKTNIKNVTNHSAQVYGIKPKKQECLWMNY